jgi:aldose 1-epimerase
MAFELTLGDERLVVSPIGAGLESWSLDGRELLADGDFGGKVLAPWPGRLRDGRYRFDGAEHRTPINEPERRNALHGLTTERRWREIRSYSRHLALACDLPPEDGYPFALALEAEYELAAGAVAVTLRATNAGSEPAPFGAGLHPYLKGDVLQLPARVVLPLDDRLLPAGDPQPVAGTELDFRSARAIAAQRIDRCFGELDRDADGIARVALSGDAGRVEVWMDASFAFVQIYTNDAGVAIEPFTCAPDAFNSGDGLLVLAPGDSFTGHCGLSATSF